MREHWHRIAEVFRDPRPCRGGVHCAPALDRLSHLGSSDRPRLPMNDSALRRRRFAYPIVTLCVAGLIWLFTTGRISVDPQVQPEIYEKFVEEVVTSARNGVGPLAESDDLIAKSWRTLAPSALRAKDGGTFQVRFVSLDEANTEVVRDALAGSPVEIRVTSGQEAGRGVYLYVRIVDGSARVVGVGALTAPAEDAESR